MRTKRNETWQTGAGFWQFQDFKFYPKDNQKPLKGFKADEWDASIWKFEVSPVSSMPRVKNIRLKAT